MTLHWDTLHKMSREEILCGACINTRFAFYEWQELDAWLQVIISDSLLNRSKGTVKLEA